MKTYRRYFIPGATYFFTQVTDGRRAFLCEESARDILRRVFRRCQARWAFAIHAVVLLPDHFHTIWALPPGDDAYPRRMGWLKKEFTKEWLNRGNSERPVTRGRIREGLRGVWQPRYWEHTLRDEDDFERHTDYIHYNPVKHGLVLRPIDWPWSSFHRWVRAGAYDRHWGGDDVTAPDFKDIENKTGE